jgi:hypothetical protein
MFFCRIALWFVSNCHTFSAREDYVEELSKHVNVTIYGRCNGKPLDNPLDVGWEKTFNMISKGSPKYDVTQFWILIDSLPSSGFFGLKRLPSPF